MSRYLQQALRRAAQGAFEELALLPPTPELDEVQRCAAREMAVAIDFRGPVCGTLYVTIHGAVAQTMAANILGEEKPLSELQQRSALKEVTNVICGNLLPQLSGPEAVFQIGVPRIVGEPARRTSDTSNLSAGLQIGLERGRADLQLVLSSTPR